MKEVAIHHKIQFVCFASNHGLPNLVYFDLRRIHNIIKLREKYPLVIMTRKLFNE